MTYNVDGNPYNRKIVDLYIERFYYDGEVHSLGFLTDITEEMEKQERLIESNEMQNVLIHELHHRVKNNLQVLASLLNLENRAYNDHPDVVVEHMMTRLSSLAMLHEKTSKNEDFRHVNLKECLMSQDMITEKLYGLQNEIELETNVDEDLNLSIEVVTPLLLIIDELTMNAIRSVSFDNATNKKISKEVRKLDDDTALLTIVNAGVSIEDSNNMGCEIIKSLTKQLGGKITSTENAYELVFPIEMKHTIH